MAVRRSGAESANSHSLPEAEEVWQRVATYVRDCLQNDRPVFTVTRSIENRITDVTEGSMGRVSAQGTTNASRVTRAMVQSLWSELRGGEGGSSYLYFTKALVLAALPGIAEDMDGELILRNDPVVLETKRRRTVMARDEGEGPQVVKAKRTAGSKSLSIVTPTWHWYLLSQVPTKESPWSMSFRPGTESTSFSLMVQETCSWSK
jgi:hypothetical protein